MTEVEKTVHHQEILAESKVEEAPGTKFSPKIISRLDRLMYQNTSNKAINPYTIID